MQSGPDDPGHQGCGPRRRRPRPCRRAAEVRHEADAGRAPDPDHPAGRHPLFRHAARPDRRPLRFRRDAHRHGAALPLRRRAALQGRGDRARSREQARAVPRTGRRFLSTSSPSTSARPRTRARCAARPSMPCRSSRSTASSIGSRPCANGCLPRRAEPGSAWSAAAPAASSFCCRWSADCGGTSRAAGHDPSGAVLPSDHALEGDPADISEAHARSLRRHPGVARRRGQNGRARGRRLRRMRSNSTTGPFCSWTRSSGRPGRRAGSLARGDRACARREGLHPGRLRPWRAFAPGVFAAGDVAAVEGHKLPKSGVYAVRQGPVLADNIRRALTGQALAPYKPQSDALYLVSTGERLRDRHPQRLRGRGRLGLAAQGLDRPPLHAEVQ